MKPHYLVSLYLSAAFSTAVAGVPSGSPFWTKDLVGRGVLRVSAPVVSAAENGILIPMTSSPTRGELEAELALVGLDGSEQRIHLSAKQGLSSSAILAVLGQSRSGWLVLTETKAGRLGIVTVDTMGEPHLVQAVDLATNGLRFRRILLLRDGSILAVGTKGASPVALRLTREGVVFWWKVFSEPGSGALVDAWEGQYGELIVAGVISGEADLLKGPRRVWLARLGPKAEVVQASIQEGSACAIVGTGDRPLLVLAADGGTDVRIAKLNPDLSLTHQHSLRVKVFTLGRIPAAASGAGSVAILGVKDLTPEIVWLLETGEEVGAVQIPDVLPSLEMQLVEDGQGAVYAIVPLIPRAREAGSFESGIRILKYPSPLQHIRESPSD